MTTGGANWFAGVIGLALLCGCAPQGVAVPRQPAPVPLPVVDAGPPLSPTAAAHNFVAVVNRVEPVAEAYCRAVGVAGNCDFRIAIDDQPGQEANAWQTIDDQGRPTLTFNLALIADARNPDELAFIMGHEAGHHIAGHIPLQEQSAMAGAVLAGLVAAAAGMSGSAMQQAEQIGASVGAASYAKDYELQADEIGAEIAWRAGYDPLRGAAFFDRIPDPGDEFLGSHPANGDRKAVVAEVVAGLQAGN